MQMRRSCARRKTKILYLCCLVSICCATITVRWITAADDETQVAALALRIKSSKWIDYFPHLQKALNSWEKSKSESSTCADKTVVELDEGRRYRKGDVLQAKIVSYNELGTRKHYGGDFFLVTVRRPCSKYDGISCETVDNADGSYSVECFLPWHGPTLLNVVLLHPSEIVFELMKRYSSEEHVGVYLYTKMLNSRNEEERSFCSVAYPSKRSDQVCNYSNPTHGEKRTCMKPLSGECSTIVWQSPIQVRGPRMLYRDSLYFREGYNFDVQIQGSKKSFYVYDRSVAPSDMLKRFKSVSKDPSTPTGWLYNASWKSFTQKDLRNIEQSTLRTCVRNKRMYFIGDSTIRMVYSHVLSVLEMKDTGFDNTVAWSRARDAESVLLNLTMHYRAHGPPLINPGPEDSRPYISDTLDGITTGGEGTVVLLTLGYHFLVLTPDVYLNRLQIIKTVIKDLIMRLPGIKIIVKGLHYQGREMHKFLWLTYRLEVILRYELGFLPGVTFIECWDETLVYNNQLLHPTGYVLEQIISHIFGYIC